MPIKYGFPSFIMTSVIFTSVIFLPRCCFICHEMELRSIANFMDALTIGI